MNLYKLIYTSSSSFKTLGVQFIIIFLSLILQKKILVLKKKTLLRVTSVPSTIITEQSCLSNFTVVLNNYQVYNIKSYSIVGHFS